MSARPTDEVLEDAENADVGLKGCLLPTGDAEIEEGGEDDSDD